MEAYAYDLCICIIEIFNSVSLSTNENNLLNKNITIIQNFIYTNINTCLNYILLI